MYCSLRNSITFLCLFGNLTHSNANRSLVKMAIKGYIKHFSGKGQVAVELTTNHYIVHWDTKFIVHTLEQTLHCGLDMLLDSKFIVNDSLVKQCVYRCAFGISTMLRWGDVSLKTCPTSMLVKLSSSWGQRSCFWPRVTLPLALCLQELISPINPKCTDNASRHTTP